MALRKTITPLRERAAAEAAIPTIRTTLVADFAMPAANATAVAQVANSAPFAVGQVIFLSPIGWLEITAKG